jgi:hypothetical protein
MWRVSCKVRLQKWRGFYRPIDLSSRPSCLHVRVQTWAWACTASCFGPNHCCSSKQFKYFEDQLFFAHFGDFAMKHVHDYLRADEFTAYWINFDFISFSMYSFIFCCSFLLEILSSENLSRIYICGCERFGVQNRVDGSREYPWTTVFFFFKYELNCWTWASPSSLGGSSTPRREFFCAPRLFFSADHNSSFRIGKEKNTYVTHTIIRASTVYILCIACMTCKVYGSDWKVSTAGNARAPEISRLSLWASRLLWFSSDYGCHYILGSITSSLYHSEKLDFGDKTTTSLAKKSTCNND